MVYDYLLLAALLFIPFGIDKGPIWRWLYRRSSTRQFARDLAVLADAGGAEERLAWRFQGETITEVPNEVLDAIDSRIVRVLAPNYDEMYVVCLFRDAGIRKQSSIPDFEDRYHDWKHGDGRERLRKRLYDFRPTAEWPITSISVVVTGHAVARRLQSERQ